MLPLQFIVISAYDGENDRHDEMKAFVCEWLGRRTNFTDAFGTYLGVGQRSLVVDVTAMTHLGFWQFIVLFMQTFNQESILLVDQTQLGEAWLYYLDGRNECVGFWTECENPDADFTVVGGVCYATVWL